MHRQPFTMDDDFDLEELADARVGDVPWYFRLGRYLSKHKIRGGDRLIAEARRRGFLDQLVIYSVGDVELRVPLWRPCNQWLPEDVLTYEEAFMRVLSSHVCQLSGDVTLIDCGADIGTVSAHLVSRCRNIKRVIAFEPNMDIRRDFTFDVDTTPARRLSPAPPIFDQLPATRVYNVVARSGGS